MSSVTSYEYPRIDDAWKSYYTRLGDESARELVVPRVSGGRSSSEETDLAGHPHRGKACGRLQRLEQG
jgi:hypothetical protein